MNKQLFPGVPLALGAAALFGASTPLSKWLIGSVDAWLLAGILYFGAGFGLLAVQSFKRLLKRPVAEAPLRSQDLPWLALVVIFGGIAGPVLLMLGLASTEASSASLLLNLEGVATMLIAWVVFRENVDHRLLVGAFAIVAGAALLSWSGGAMKLSQGTLFIAAACVAWGIDNNLTRKLSSSDPVQIVIVKGLVAGLVNIGLANAMGAQMPAIGTALAGALVGFFGVGVSLVMFMLALRHLGTARTGAYFSTAPFVGAALSLILFSEPLSLQLVAAALLMAIGVWLHVSERHEHEHTHAELAHEHRHSHDEHHQHEHLQDEATSEPHTHWHVHKPIRHKHPHYPDIHHRHGHT